MISATGMLDGVEAIARIAEDDQIDEVDPAGLLSLARLSKRTPAVVRVVTLLSATAHWAIPGLQTGGIFAEWRDEGFKRAFQDHELWPDSSKQVGHFLTALGLGLVPELVEQPIAYLIKANRYSAGIEGRIKRFLIDSVFLARALLRTNIVIGGSVDELTETTTIKTLILGDKIGTVRSEEFCVRLVIGHEKVPDPRWGSVWRFVDQYMATTDKDVALWSDATLALAGDDGRGQASGNGAYRPPSTWKQQTATVAGIRLARMFKVDESQYGNSYADLFLSLMGWYLGQYLRYDGFGNGQQLGAWLRQQLHS